MVNVFEGTVNFLGKSIQRFVVSMSVIFILGMLYALIVVPIHPMLLFIPVILAFIAYFSRVFAFLVFIGFILIFFVL